ncbi:tetratricopeptide repeat protein [Bradyrhizobium sp. HKCCYLS3077]|uniref:tetratricopeptide repeat protein n=1 Tax=Bradyrhizobium sp. HKCCYLS3077 TaxID=3420761 RepID=UPI003EB8FF41
MMSPTRFALAVIVIAELVSTQGLAYDAVGTAGPIRSFGSRRCDLGYAARQRGECDPPAIASALPAELRSRQRVDRARELIQLLRTEPALEELNTAIVEDPANASALLLRARLRIPGQLSEAAADVNRVLEINPDASDALATKAFINVTQDDQGSLQIVTKALSLNPTDIDALWIRAFIATRLGKLEQAESDLDRAVELEPDNPTTRLDRAELRLRTGNNDGAREDADAVLAVRPDLRALQLRAAIRTLSGDDAGALADLNALLGFPGARQPPGPVRPDLVNLYVQRALLLTRSGKLQEAGQDLETIVALGGRRAVLQMQVYLRGHGFRDVGLDGKRSEQLDDALRACFINNACGRGIAIRG